MKEIKPAKKFTIERSRWLRGRDAEGENKSSLLDENGHQCCLGFFASACGYKDAAMIGLPTLDHLLTVTSYHEKTFGIREERAGTLMGVNDAHSQSCSEREREAEIARLFALDGITVEFID